MIQTLDDVLGRGIAAWVDRVARRPGRVVAAFALVSVAALAYTFAALGVNTNEDDLFSEDLSYFALRNDYYEALPSLVDPIVVVVDGTTIDLAHDAAETLARRLEERPDHFAAVYRPGGGPFFERNGFLYLEREELEELAENLFSVQPYLAELSRETSLRGFLAMLGEAVEATAKGELEGLNLTDVLERVNDVIVSYLAGEIHHLSWADVITGRESNRHDRRRFLLVQPRVDFEQLQPAEAALLGLREIVQELGYDGRNGVRVRATGIFPLAYEEMEHVSAQAAWAGLASFVLVGLILGAGLRSARLVLSALATLLSGLALTAGFATAAVGYLNLISVAFGVLFIGLSIDFAIHLCVRYRELLARGEGAVALRAAAGSVGGSLTLCAVTTAIGFFAFIPTEYAGVAELGLIAGAGMFISLFANLTLLPALIAWWAPPETLQGAPPSLARIAGLLGAPVRYARTVVGVTALLTVGALALTPEIYFDPNPLRMRDPSTDSVSVFSEMLADGDALLWNLNVLADDLDAAHDLAARLEALPTVEYAVTLSDYVPEGQTEKRAILEDVAYVLLPTLTEDGDVAAPTPEEKAAAIGTLEESLGPLGEADQPEELRRAANALRASLAALRARWASGAPGSSIDEIEAALVGSLPERLRILRAGLQPAPVGLGDLPADLVSRMTATDGRARIEIFPQEDLNDQPALEAYVASVQEIAPATFGEGLVILETGRAVVRSLRQALLTAAVLIVGLLLLLWRSAGDALLVSVPLALASLFTAAGSVILSVPFNFANVIVIPLLLGMGVDTGIHLVHRTRTESLPDGNLLRTGTAGAVLLSALTTMASFGTLGLSSHLGMASLGRLLALGIALIVVCNLLVLPALVRVTGRARKRT